MKKIIIIGAGVAGLSAGILAQKSGFDTEIHEMHTLPGGLCTSWKRGSYLFDGCIRYVYGSGEGRFFHSVMKEIGADSLHFIHHSESICVETSTGEAVTFYCDLDRLKEHLLKISPEDGKPVKTLIKLAKSLSRASMPMTGMKSPADLIRTIRGGLSFMRVMLKYRKASLGSFAASLKSVALREAFAKYYGYTDLEELPLLVLIIDMAQHHAGNAGWPLGGSIGFARRLEENYLSLGGAVHYRSKVEKILVKDGRAVGIRLEGGQERMADYILSAGDVHAALYEWLDGKYTTSAWEEAFRNDKPITPVIQVSLGIDADISHIPHNIALYLEKPIEVAGIRYDYLSFRHYWYDRAMAPEGKSALVAVLETDYETWEQLCANKQRYAEEKQSAAKQVVERIERRFPEIAGKVEVVDVATPMTYVRYTGNYQGSVQGWQTYMGHILPYSGELPGLKGFMMIGQWVQRGGGLPGGAVSAFNAVKKICKEYGVKMG